MNTASLSRYVSGKLAKRLEGLLRQFSPQGLREAEPDAAHVLLELAL